MSNQIKSFKFIGHQIIEFLLSADGVDYIENILVQPLSWERCRLFIKKSERIWALSHTCGRLWGNSGTTLILFHQENNVMTLLSSVLHKLLIAGKYSPQLGKILTMRKVALNQGMPYFDLFVYVVLLPEISIQIAKLQFRGSYSIAEEQYLRFSSLLVKVGYFNCPYLDDQCHVFPFQ